MPGSVSSQVSNKSKSELKTECPYCQQSLQNKNLFHHIRICHPSQFLENTQKKWIEEAETGKPLKMIWETNIDEELGHSDMVIIYGCLATDKCFMTEERAMRHFKHNPAELKKHNTQLRKLKKEFLDKKKKEKIALEKNPAHYLFHKALKENDPKLIEGIWRGMLHWKTAGDVAISLGSCTFKDVDYVYEKDKKCTWPQAVEKYSKMCLKVKKALEEDNKEATKLFTFYNWFWSFLSYWKQNFKEIKGYIDPRFDESNQECIVVSRDDSMGEEYFYCATKKMPMPVPENFNPPEVPPSEPPEDDTESETSTQPKTIIEVAEAVGITEKDIEKLSTSILSGKKVLVPELEILKNKPKTLTIPRQDFYGSTKEEPVLPKFNIIAQTKRPPKQATFQN